MSDEGLGVFLGAAPLRVWTLENPDAAGVGVAIEMANPVSGEKLRAIMTPIMALQVAAALAVVATYAEEGIVGVTGEPA